MKLAFFTAEGCRLCRALLPQAERLGAVIFDEVADAAAWTAADVPGAPFAIALAADGTVLAKGTVNTRRQLASVPATARAGDGAHPEPRLIGNVAIEVRLEDGEPRVLAGFENHGGRTHLGAGEQPLGRVLKGHGNTGSSGAEGVRWGSVIGTYLHGPLLPKNAWFADWLIRTALGLDELAALDDTLEDAAHAEARRAARV